MLFFPSDFLDSAQNGKSAVALRGTNSYFPVSAAYGRVLLLAFAHLSFETCNGRRNCLRITHEKSPLAPFHRNVASRSGDFVGSRLLAGYRRTITGPISQTLLTTYQGANERDQNSLSSRPTISFWLASSISCLPLRPWLWIDRKAISRLCTGDRSRC